jgi:hypothetical protein
MRVSLKLKTIIKLLLLIFVVTIIGLSVYNFKSNIIKFKNSSDNFFKSGDKIIDKKDIINEIKEKQELIVLQIDLSKTITIDDSFGDYPILKKSKDITFNGTGSYSVDLSSFNSDSISIDNKNKCIELSIPKPKINMVTINEDKTLYGSVDRGVLRFGDITLSPENYSNILNSVKSKMKDSLGTDEFYSKALDSTNAAMKNFITSILGSSNEYKFNIKIVEQS